MNSVHFCSITHGSNQMHYFYYLIILLLQQYKEDNKLIREQQTSETNPIFKLARINTEQSEPNTD